MVKGTFLSPLYRAQIVEKSGKVIHSCGKVSANSEYFRDPKNGVLVSIEKDSVRRFIVSINTKRSLKQKVFSRRQLEEMVAGAENKSETSLEITIEQVTAEIEISRIRLLLGGGK